MSKQLITTSGGQWRVKPYITYDILLKIVEDCFGIILEKESIKELVSYDDRNFCVQGCFKNSSTTTKYKFMIKIYNFGDSLNTKWYENVFTNMFIVHERCSKDFQTPLPIHNNLTNTPFGFCDFPLKDDAVFSDCSREDLSQHQHAWMDGSHINLKHIIRVTKFIPGSAVNVKEMSELSAFSYGKCTGMLIQAMKDLPPPKENMRGKWIWNLLAASKMLLTPYITSITNEETKEKYLQILRNFDDYSMLQLSKLSKQWVHGDLNDQNVMQDNEQITGIIDFDDMCYSYRIVDIATVMMYISCMSVTEQRCVINLKAIFAGITSVIDVNDIELSVLYNLMLVRYVQSLSLAQYQYEFTDPGNEYLLLTSKPAKDVLEFLLKIGEKQFIALLVN